MNDATLAGFRNLAETLYRPMETRTAREMALTSHDLNHDGYRATEPDGTVWYWSDKDCVWCR